MIHMRMRHDNVGNACIRRRVEQCLEVSVVIGARVYDRNPVHAEKIRLRTGKRHWSRIWCRDNPEAGCEFQGDADLNLVVCHERILHVVRRTITIRSRFSSSRAYGRGTQDL